ncbi:MAG: amidohydrolase, partial [Phycisphaerae bacterium]
MSSSLIREILIPLEELRLIDPHTHINPHSPASSSLADILGYHYYTELAHSSGLPKERIEEPGLAPKAKVARLIPYLATIENTA